MNIYTIRNANHSDLSSIIGILSDDPLGQARENAALPPTQSYIDVINSIIRDENADLVVVEIGGAV